MRNSRIQLDQINEYSMVVSYYEWIFQKSSLFAGGMVDFMEKFFPQKIFTIALTVLKYSIPASERKTFSGPKTKSQSFERKSAAVSGSLGGICFSSQNEWRLCKWQKFVFYRKRTHWTFFVPTYTMIKTFSFFSQCQLRNNSYVPSGVFFNLTWDASFVQYINPFG